MRLLHVVPTYLPAWRYGGPIRTVHGLCRALARRGHEVQVCTTDVDGEGVSAVPLEAPVDVDGVSVCYHRCGSPRRLYRSPAMGRTLRRTVGEVDLVHLHAMFAWPTLAAARIAARHRVPYVVTPRGMLVDALIRGRSRWLKTAWLWLADRRTLAEAAAVHFTTDVEARATAALGLPVPRAEVIPHGVDPPPSAAVPAAGGAAPRGMPYLLYLGRISWEKGLDRLIPALAALPGVPLRLAGNDESGYAGVLERLAARHGVADRVTFLGMVEGERKWALLRDAALVVLPSYSENLGLSVLEALSVGTPVVVSEAVGLAPEVRASGAGVVCSGARAALAAAVGTGVGDDARRRAMGARGLEMVQARYGWDHIAERMEGLYSSILER